MTEFIGYITNVEVKNGIAKGSGKPYTVYNVTATEKDGSSTRVGWGFDAPTFQEGVWIKTQVEQNGQYLNYKGAIVEVKPGAAPAQSESPQTSGTGTATGDVQTRIMYQNSRQRAVEVVNLCLTHNALPVSEAKGKSGAATRYEQVLDFVNKLTVQLTRDVETLRLLETVADAGDVDVPAKGELPEEIPVEEPEQEEIDSDDIPF